MAIKGNTAVARILKQEGVDLLFCFPANSLIDACAKEGIRPVLTRTERTLVNMADGYSRVTNGRHIGVACTQGGPGVENAFAGVAQAFAESTPVLFLPDGPDQAKLGNPGPGNFDPIRSYATVAKLAERINQPARIGEFLRRAFTSLRNVRGPVLLEVPRDVQLADVDEELGYISPSPHRAQGDPADVKAPVRALLAATNPIILSGMGVLYAEATEELKEFAELVQTPVATTLSGKSGFPEDHALAAGTYSATAAGPAGRLLREADLIFGVGTSTTKGSLSIMLPPGKRLVQTAIDGADIGRDYLADVVVLGDAKLVLCQLIEEVKRVAGAECRRGSDSAVRYLTGLREAWLAQWAPKLTSAETPINPYRVIADLQRAIDPATAIVTHDSGNPRDQTVPFYRAVTPRGYIGWGHSKQLGYGYGLAMGAKLAAPEKTVVNIIGDAGFGMCGMEVETASRSKIGVLTIILNNSAMGGYEKHLPVATEKWRTKFLSGDYADMARALGAHSERVTDPEQIIPSIKRAFPHLGEGQPAVLEMITCEDTEFSR